MSRYEVLLLVGMTAVTFGVRYPVMALMSRWRMPPSLERALRYIPPAVLAAIIAPAIFMPAGELAIRLDNAALAAGIAAALLSWRTRNLLLAIVGGMVVYWVWRLLVGMVM